MDDQNTTEKLMYNGSQTHHKTKWLVLLLVLVVVIACLAFLNQKGFLPNTDDLAHQQFLAELEAEPKFTLTESQKAQIERDIQKPPSRQLSDAEKEAINKSLQE